MMQVTAEFTHCPVCSLPCSMRYSHFGGICCPACASFFRRTVSLNIRYLCKKQNNCSGVSKKYHIVCRACRYEKCIKKAGMKRSLVQHKQSDKNVPKYILLNEDRAVEFVRGFTTSPPMLKASPVASEDFSKILNIGSRGLLSYYVKQVESVEKQKFKNALQIQSINELLTLQRPSTNSCLHCPGVDILDRESALALKKHFQFADVWLDSAWEFSKSPELFLALGRSNLNNTNQELTEFISLVKSTLVSPLSRLRLDLTEFAAFKAIATWKLIYHETSTAMKIIAQEQYEGVTCALRRIYKNSRSMDDIEIAVRIGELTLLISAISEIYKEMVRLYRRMGV